MGRSLARGGEVPVIGHADVPVPDRGMQVLEYAVAVLALLAAALLAFVR